MKISTQSAQVEIQIPFHDVDRVNIAWHGHYFRYFEIARTELMRLHQLDADDIIELGFGMVVSESKCRHVSPARYGDTITVKASFVDISHHLDIGYLVKNKQNGKVIARGRTQLVCINPSFDLLTKIPAVILERITQ